MYSPLRPTSLLHPPMALVMEPITTPPDQYGAAEAQETDNVCSSVVDPSVAGTGAGLATRVQASRSYHTGRLPEKGCCCHRDATLAERYHIA